VNGKRLFVVRGSEDGNLGVYSNVKRAYAKAVEYLCQNGEVKLTISVPVNPEAAQTQREWKDTPASYRLACERLGLRDWLEINIVGERTTAQIEALYLNT